MPVLPADDRRPERFPERGLQSAREARSPGHARENPKKLRPARSGASIHSGGTGHDIGAKGGKLWIRKSKNHEDRMVPISRTRHCQPFDAGHVVLQGESPESVSRVRLPLALGALPACQLQTQTA
jgi:hypothetical protein